MNGQSKLELVIDSREQGAVDEIQSSLSEVKVERLPTARVLDPVVILGIVGGALKVIDELLALAERLKAKSSSPAVSVRNRKGRTIALATITKATLEEFIKE
jgi:hypothetical protein